MDCHWVAEYLHGRLHIILLNVGRLHTSGFRSEGENSLTCHKLDHFTVPNNSAPPDHLLKLFMQSPRCPRVLQSQYLINCGRLVNYHIVAKCLLTITLSILLTGHTESTEIDTIAWCRST